MQAGIREVKNRFSEYLRRVKQGEIIVITERNVPVARLVPVQEKGQLPVLTLVEAHKRGGEIDDEGGS